MSMEINNIDPKQSRCKFSNLVSGDTFVIPGAYGYIDRGSAVFIKTNFQTSGSMDTNAICLSDGNANWFKDTQGVVEVSVTASWTTFSDIPL